MATPAELVAAAVEAVNGLRPFSVISNQQAQPTVQGPRDYQQAMLAITAALQALADATGGIQSLANVGGGAGVLQGVVGTQGRFRTLVAGANVTIAETADEVSIAAAGGGGGSTTRNTVSLAGAAGAVALTTAQLGGFGLVTFTEINGNFGGGGVTSIALPTDDGSLVPGLIVVLSIEGPVGIPTTWITPPAGGELTAPPTTNYTTGTDGLLLILRYNGDDGWSFTGAVEGNNPI